MWKLFPPKFLAAKKAIKIIPMGVDDKAQPYLAWSNLFRTQNCLTWERERVREEEMSCMTPPFSRASSQSLTSSTQGHR